VILVLTITIPFRYFSHSMDIIISRSATLEKKKPLKNKKNKLSVMVFYGNIDKK